MEKKTPERMCLGCRGMFPKRELIRIVRSPEGEISLDATGKKNGRGAYICRKRACLDKCVRSRQLARAFRCDIPAEVYERLAAELEEDA